MASHTPRTKFQFLSLAGRTFTTWPLLTSAAVPPPVCPTTCFCAFANTVPSVRHALPLLLHLANVHSPLKTPVLLNLERVSRFSPPSAFAMLMLLGLQLPLLPCNYCPVGLRCEHLEGRTWLFSISDSPAQV